MGEDRGRDFFISYTGVNVPWARWIAVELEAAGYSTVLQDFDFRPGADFVHEMHRATGTAKRTIAVLSPAYFASEFSEAEWRIAFADDPSGDRRLLVPVRVQPCRPPGLLKTKVYVDLVDADEATCRQKLLDEVNKDWVRPKTAEFPGSPVTRTLGAARFPGSSPDVRDGSVHRSTGDDRVRVLISYAHDNEPHSELVRTFWTFLRGEGIDARLDVAAANQRQFWPDWMSEQIRAAAFVIVVASPAYRERAEHCGDPSIGRGVRWEARQLKELMYRDGDDGFRTIVPVVLPGGRVEDLPDWVLPVGGTIYQVREFTSDAADHLLRMLTGQPLDIEPPLGQVRPRPWRPFAVVNRSRLIRKPGASRRRRSVLAMTVALFLLVFLTVLSRYPSAADTARTERGWTGQNGQRYVLSVNVEAGKVWGTAEYRAPGTDLTKHTFYIRECQTDRSQCGTITATHEMRSSAKQAVKEYLYQACASLHDTAGWELVNGCTDWLSPND